ncbi:MAG: M23 family metallopeptidase [Alphaproteobacteria bacterium]|nr:M23 family metallopeptidase [Alphaproteobacteria bacterium]MCB9692594.1 M23 family metallopeptidase [Alphaproteobacteria bacterium]
MLLILLACGGSEPVSPQPAPEPPPEPTAEPSDGPVPTGDTAGEPPIGVDPLVLPALPALGMPVSARPIASAFGPRVHDGSPEMHLGIDLHGTRGEDVLAALPGTVRTVRVPQTPSQSLFVILEHPVAPFAWQGGTYDRIYTSYHHLESTELVEDAPIAAGDVVGGMGDSGGAAMVHLHLELRLGTSCSLEYQLANPDSSCVTGFSPHVDPLMALPTPETPLELAWTSDRLTIRAALDDPSIRRVETPDGVLDLATWEGFDPSSEAALDVLDRGWVTLVPEDAADARVLHLDFATRPEWVRVWDARGNGVVSVP